MYFLYYWASFYVYRHRLLSELLRHETFYHHVIRVDLFGGANFMAVVAISVAVFVCK
jgi:hypothetical protein